MLALRVARALEGEPAADRPVAVEGVCRGRVRREPPRVGEPFPDCLRRTFRQDSGLEVDSDNVVDARAVEIRPGGAWVDVVTYACRPR